MWICLNNGFVSIVKDKLNKNDFVVRSRRKEILENLFPNNEITTLSISDYKYRTYCSKKDLSDILINRIEQINYTNFKNSVRDYDLHDLYNSFWFSHYNYQK